MTRVLVSGCYDLLHLGHVRFLEAAAARGALTVCVASDETVLRLKGRPPEVPEAERLEAVAALRCVRRAVLSPGRGPLDFAEWLVRLRPDFLAVNFDGDLPEKRALCLEHGVGYLVLDQRTGPHTSGLRRTCRIPYRVDLAGGWLDQPSVSRLAPGPVVVASVEPEREYDGRSGMATSTRETARRLWGCRLPAGDRRELARRLFACENPPGTEEVSGSQDALGIVLPGVSRLDYAGRYWPEAVESSGDPGLAGWLESRLRLVGTAPRPEGFSVLAETAVTAAGAGRLAAAARECWDALAGRDGGRLGRAVTASCRAQLAMFPRMHVPELERAWGDPRWLGAKLCGAGGGGYLLLVARSPDEPEGLRFRIVRPDD